jgi:hypothetical protein
MYIIKYDSSWNTCGSNDSLVSSTSGTLGTITTVTPTVTSPTGFITPRTPTVGSGGTVTTVCIVGIQSISNEIPVSFKLFQNYPNPFNPTTKIKFDLPKSNLTLSGAKGLFVRLIIYDILGREIALLVNDQLSPGMYEVDWSATGGAENYPSGIYFYRLAAGDPSKSSGQGYSETRKMVLLK